MRILKNKEKNNESGAAVVGKGTKIFAYTVLTIAVIAVILPLLWLFLTSMKTRQDLAHNTWGLPEVWEFKNYVIAWTGSKIPRYMLNSVRATGLSILLTVVLFFIADLTLLNTTSNDNYVNTTNNIEKNNVQNEATSNTVSNENSTNNSVNSSRNTINSTNSVNESTTNDVFYNNEETGNAQYNANQLDNVSIGLKNINN